MTQLIKNISAEIIDQKTSSASLVKLTSSTMMIGDYIGLDNYIAFLQDFSNVKTFVTLEKPLDFGLKNQYNVELRTLDISY
jgi:hypothetical protein